MILVLVEHDRGSIAPAALEAMTAARGLADQIDMPVHALTIGQDADDLVGQLADYGAAVVYQAHHQVLGDYGPEAWGEVMAQAIEELEPSYVIATGTDRGNEVLAQAAARRGLPMIANVLELRPNANGDDTLEVARVRWGGSLLEVASMTAETVVVTIAAHSIEATESTSPGDGEVEELDVSLDDSLARTVVVDRIENKAGVTLATAPVVVGGGRGVGSPEGFGPLQELADLLNGAVGCSRAVTNNGWRNHTDQVGQTGTRIAPEVYLACGISGAVQHWVGAMASKTIIAINTDDQANMVTKADYAVIADLHKMVPAIAEEIRKRRA